MKNFTSSILIAAAGILIGALSVANVNKYREAKHLYKSTYADWRKLNLILDQVDRDYVDSVDKQKLTDAAVEAALRKLDPHSVYMPPVELKESDESLAAGFDGIGIQFNVPNDTAIVLEVIPGGPSEKIGLLPGDRLLKVDSINIAGVHYPQDSMVRRMRGLAGTKVTVTVGREGEVIPFEITRGKIPLHSVDAAFMYDSMTGYIRLGKFSMTTGKEVSEACDKLASQGMKNLVFDLRGNSGGYLDQALKVCDLFLGKDSLIVYMEGRHRPREDFRASGRGKYQDIGLSVLVDEGSASSSEIFAGAMQDNGRAKIVGRRSFGKGLVQEPVNFTDGSGIRLTVARFYTPSGRCIQKPYTDDYEYEVFKRYGEGEMVAADSMKAEKGGIIPDVFVPLDTTRATNFYLACNRKATTMRYASAWFDSHSRELSSITTFAQLNEYFRNADIEGGFLNFAKQKDGIAPRACEMKEFREYILPNVRALIGRYSRLGDNAFYYLFLPGDPTFKKALEEGFGK